MKDTYTTRPNLNEDLYEERVNNISEDVLDHFLDSEDPWGNYSVEICDLAREFVQGSELIIYREYHLDLLKISKYKNAINLNFPDVNSLEEVLEIAAEEAIYQDVMEILYSKLR